MKIEYFVVVVENEFSGNAGSIARVMGNFSFDKLILINPLWKDETEGIWMAHTELGKTIFKNRILYKDFDDFLFKEAPNLIIGFTRRSGKDREISANYRDFFDDFYNSITQNNFIKYLEEEEIKSFEMIQNLFKIALVFGKESTGLEDDLIKKCDKLLYIPTNPESPSLNLSQAVCIILGEIYFLENVKYKFLKEKNRKKINAGLNFEVESLFKLASFEDKEEFFNEIYEASKKKKLFIRNDLEKFKRLFNRIFSSPYITKRDLLLLKKYILRFIFAPLKEDNNE